MNFRPVFFLLVATFLLASCTMEKRRYMSGYHVEWAGNNLKNSSKAQLAQKTESADAPTLKSVSDSSLSCTPNFPESDRLTESTVTGVRQYSANRATTRSKKTEETSTETSGRSKKPGVFAPLAHISIQSASTGRNVDVSGKHIMAYIGFGFALATIVFMSIALFFSTGWAALGYIALAVLAMCGAALFSIISLFLFLKSEESIPWYELFALVVGVIGIGIALRIWVFP